MIKRRRRRKKRFLFSNNLWEGSLCEAAVIDMHRLAAIRDFDM
jgi:hypothetical protein